MHIPIWVVQRAGDSSDAKIQRRAGLATPIMKSSMNPALLQRFSTPTPDEYFLASILCRTNATVTVILFVIIIFDFEQLFAYLAASDDDS